MLAKMIVGEGAGSGVGFRHTDTLLVPASGCALASMVAPCCRWYILCGDSCSSNAGISGLLPTLKTKCVLFAD